MADDTPGNSERATNAAPSPRPSPRGARLQLYVTIEESCFSQPVYQRESLYLASRRKDFRPFPKERFPGGGGTCSAASARMAVSHVVRPGRDVAAAEGTASLLASNWF